MKRAYLVRVERENARLRNALTEMLTDHESVILNSDWWGSWPKPPRLCAMLARYLREEYGARGDVAMLRRVRAALGLPWWGALDYEDGLLPGEGRR